MEAQGRTKWCPGCERALPLDGFGISRARADGRARYCRECRTAAGRARRAARPQPGPDPPAGLMRCTGCAPVLPLEAFPTARQNADGRRGRCRDCTNADRRDRRAQESKPQTRRKYATRAERDRAFYERHRERLLALQRAYRRANRAALAEQAHARYLANREARAAYSRAYKLTNRERINAQQRAASAAARERVPGPILPAENPC